MHKSMRMGLNGYVLSPFGDFGEGFDISALFTTIQSVANTVGQVANSVKQPTATAYQPQAQQQYQQPYQQQNYQAASMMPPDNTMLYVGAGLAGLLVLALVLKK